MGGVLHLWGPAAAGPEGDAAAVAAHVRACGGPPEVVVVPSYWGGVRRGLLERELAAAGCPDALVTGIDDELRGLEPPLTPRSVLVEEERGRLAVTELRFPAGPSETRLTHAQGPPVDVVLAAAGFDPAGVAPAARAAPPDAEFLVAAAPGSGLVGDLRRRGHLAYPVPAELLGTSEVRAPVPAPSPPPDPDPVAPAAPGGAEGDPGCGFDVGELRRRARPARRARLPRVPRVPRVSPWAPLGALAAAAVVAAVAVVLVVPGPPPAPPAPAAEDAGPDAPPAARPWDLPDPGAPAAVHRLAAAGASVELPVTWRLADGAPPGALAAVDGGPMRILAVAAPPAPGLTPARLAEGLAEGAAADPALGPVGDAVVRGVGVVTHEERPGDGTVVLWHHRVVDGRQVSVGCQFRVPVVPHVRPTCDAAVASARPA